MEIFGFGTTEVLVIALLAVVVLGPERMVRVMREIGKFIRNLKAYFSTLSDELKSELDLMDELKEINKLKQDLDREMKS
ncbi:MAG: twin-arginine translocase subunit TatB [Chloroflexi bacterium]|jgi:sec-independent protein translocase protein TatB|nr:twin-arginine translocase subunit TatB [Chloroflexota bacterium]